MSIFEFVTVAISIILGLGVAEILSSALNMVRTAGRSRLHWVPITWALLIFWIQLEFWWSLFELHDKANAWTHGNFFIAILTAMFLFAAGSLVLPKVWPEEDGNVDLFEFFRRQGKYGVAAFLMFHLCAIPLNHRLFGSRVFSITTALITLMIVAQMGVVLSKTRRQMEVFTALFLALQLWIMRKVIFPA